jgi:hypothetical protein
MGTTAPPLSCRVERVNHCETHLAHDGFDDDRDDEPMVWRPIVIVNG